jgi:2-haloalkanoic acid dehalogenase type II
VAKSLTEFNVLSFDCYGTLIDWETGIWDALQPLLARNRGGVTRAQALAGFGTLENRIERESPNLPYPQVLAAVHAALARECGLRTSPALDRAFGRSVGGWPAFADTAEALRRLHGHYRLVILSNVDRRSFAASRRKLGVRFDAIYTAEDIGSYKPAAANFEYLIRKVGEDLGRGPADVLHVAQSLYHDHVPARAHGLANAWIDRQQLSRGGAQGATSSATASVAASVVASVVEWPPVDFQFASMAALAAAAQAAFAAAAP